MSFTVKRAVALSVVTALLAIGLIVFVVDWHTSSTTPIVLAAAALVSAVCFDALGWTRRGRARLARRRGV